MGHGQSEIRNTESPHYLDLKQNGEKDPLARFSLIEREMSDKQGEAIQDLRPQSDLTASLMQIQTVTYANI